MFAELVEGIRINTPAWQKIWGTAEDLAERYGVTDRSDVFALARALERVWHLMRLATLLAGFFGDRICFGGGSILNYVYAIKYGEAPRFTFDLDSSWVPGARSKREILYEILRLNKWLSANGYTVRVPVSTSKRVELFTVEYDVEKNHFPDILSLRVPVVTRFDGEPFHSFLGIKDYAVITRLREVFSTVLGVRDARIDYIRFEISLSAGRAPRTILVSEDILGNRLSLQVTELEYQLASKLMGKVGKDFGAALPYALHDILKAALDLRLLRYVDRGKVASYIENLDIVKNNTGKNLNALIKEGQKYWRGYHYILVRARHSLEEIVETIKNLLLDM